MHRFSPPFPFIALLEGHASEIRLEAARLRAEDYVDWPLREAYTGAWRVHCIFSRDPRWLLAPMCAANARRCPRTAAVLARISGCLRGGFSLLMPGTHIHPHLDQYEEESLRCHLALRTNPDARMRFGADVVTWQEGRCLVFDNSVAHEAANLGSEARVVCLVDVLRSTLTHEVGP